MPTAAPRRPAPWIQQIPAIADYRVPARLARLPRRASIGGLLLLLLAVSAFIRTRYLSGQLWGDEAIATGIASHSFGAIFGVLRHDGSAPLYFLLLHVWISLFGSGEAATHTLSLLLGLISVPIALWAGWSLDGQRTGVYAATLFAFSAFLTEYAQETQVYELLAVLGLLGAVGFLQAFVRGRRAFTALFAAALVAMLYTSVWALLFWVGAAIALIAVLRAPGGRPGLTRDAVVAYGIAFVLVLPWLPTLAYQIGHDTSPWTFSVFTGPTFPASLVGGDRVLATFTVVAAAALLPLWTPERRTTRDAVALWALVLIILGGLAFAAALAPFAQSWVTRYFAPLVGAVLLLVAFTAARTGVLGLIAVILSIAFVANAASFSPKYKSDMRDIAGELAPLLRPGDTVLTGAPEQVPLAWYYMPAGLHFATVTGPVTDARAMNWSDAYTRLADATPARVEDALVAGLTPGRHLLFTRPLTEGAEGWLADWSALVRRRSAQWGHLLATDPRLQLVAGARAPHNYRGSCCVADSALIYTRIG